MDITAGKHGGDPFSTEAHTSIISSKEQVRAKVYGYIERQGIQGATADEVEEALDMLPQSVSARFTELKALSKIELIGKRKTRSGRNAGVWAAKQMGQGKMFP